MTISIRSARLSDAEAIATLTHQLGYEADAPTVAIRLKRILDREDQRFVVAESAEQVIGWLHMETCEYVECEPFVVIAGLVVDHRRKGVGRLLMEQAEQWASDRGLSVIRLRSSASRSAAHAFYHSIGYRHIKTQYSFAKPLHGVADEQLMKLVPRV